MSGSDPFCNLVLEIFSLGITTGTTPTTYDPTSGVTRLQMAAFLSRSVDGVLKRGNRRAALKQFWTPQSSTVLGITTVGNNPTLLESDGSDVWVTNFNGNSVSRVRGSDRNAARDLDGGDRSYRGRPWAWDGFSWGAEQRRLYNRSHQGGRIRHDRREQCGRHRLSGSRSTAVESGTANLGSVSIVTPDPHPLDRDDGDDGVLTAEGILSGRSGMWVADYAGTAREG